jgi:hypothetical protein
LVPDNVRVPDPLLSRAVLLVPSWITPANVVEVLLPPVVSVALEPPPLVTMPLPLPASEAIIELLPPRSRVEFTVNAELLEKAPADPAFKVPADTVVVPV